MTMVSGDGHMRRPRQKMGAVVNGCEKDDVEAFSEARDNRASFSSENKDNGLIFPLCGYSSKKHG